MSQTLVLSNSSLASSSFRSLTEEDGRRVRERRKEREARSLAIEKAYVHDVYEQISGETLSFNNKLSSSVVILYFSLFLLNLIFISGNFRKLL